VKNSFAVSTIEAIWHLRKKITAKKMTFAKNDNPFIFAYRGLFWQALGKRPARREKATIRSATCSASI
jgi:hypothetical protein